MIGSKAATAPLTYVRTSSAPVYGSSGCIMLKLNGQISYGSPQPSVEKSRPFVRGLVQVEPIGLPVVSAMP